ncbi:MAG: HAD hydrolase family protein [Candidatus Eiseniibacteriota bacterium]|nr:MAG: HAD hydrolase family protein [Candidatus Eisenbacteria bacterium]
MTARLTRIRAVFFDVDGVLTDGKIYLGREEEMKAFSARDGLAVRMACEAGIDVFLVTGRTSTAVARRADELGVRVFQGVRDKLSCVRSVCEKRGYGLAEAAFVGDDLPDVSAMREVGVAWAVADGVAEVKDVAHLTTASRGGEGVAREVIEKIMRSQGKWQESVKQFLK